MAHLSARRLLAPEVVQTSAMDCGPASLKSLLEGFGISASYGRLREACQTQVDGTSIDKIEEVAVQMGLDAEQFLVARDNVLLAETAALPAIAITAGLDGTTHFVVVWRKQGPLVQVMDPRSGRRWYTHGQFLDQLYIHEMPVDVLAWRAWAATQAFLEPLRRRLLNLGIRRSAATTLLQQGLDDSGWRTLVCLDATVRMVQSLVNARGIRKGDEALGLLKSLLRRALAEGLQNVIPNPFRSVQPLPGAEDQLLIRGAVLVTVHGRTKPPTGEPAASRKLPPELEAALREPPPRILRELLTQLTADGVQQPLFLLGALVMSATVAVFEALLFQGLLDIADKLTVYQQRLGFFLLLLGFFAVLLALEMPLQAELLRLGRVLELRLRTEVLAKFKRLGLRYFQSRPASDMTERHHTMHLVRNVPTAFAQIVRTTMTLVVITLGLIWLSPGSTPVAVLAALVALVLPLCLQPALLERDLRLRIHGGSLTRFYLDALLGLVPIRAHGAERSVRIEHESLLVEWRRAGLGLLRVNTWITGLEALAGLGLTLWLVLHYLARAGDQSNFLLLVYWALNLPLLGQTLAQSLRQYPVYRNVLLRLLEPLGAPDEKPVGSNQVAVAAASSQDSGAAGCAIALRGVWVQAGGHTILSDIDLDIPAGGHVAIVGASGAGKSSLVGVLLGWHSPSSGHIEVDGAPLDCQALRPVTAWVDPMVQLWNDTLFNNLLYGVRYEQAATMSSVIMAADLRDLLKRLPEGLQSVLGEGGTLVSGGEGQRVRLGRAMLRSRVRLAVLDEPFRGLDRSQRAALLAQARAYWHDATLLCVTHDIAETLSFPRVLVIEEGRMVEDGVPGALAAQSHSRYRALLDAEAELQEQLWTEAVWQRWRLVQGHVVTHPAAYRVIAASTVQPSADR